MISSVAKQNYSAQENYHLLLQLPKYSTPRDFVILSLDGSRKVPGYSTPQVSLQLLSSSLTTTWSSWQPPILGHDSVAVCSVAQDAKGGGYTSNPNEGRLLSLFAPTAPNI